MKTENRTQDFNDIKVGDKIFSTSITSQGQSISESEEAGGERVVGITHSEIIVESGFKYSRANGFATSKPFMYKIGYWKRPRG